MAGAKYRAIVVAASDPVVWAPDHPWSGPSGYSTNGYSLLSRGRRDGERLVTGATIGMASALFALESADAEEGDIRGAERFTAVSARYDQSGYGFFAHDHTLPRFTSPTSPAITELPDNIPGVGQLRRALAAALNSVMALPKKEDPVVTSHRLVVLRFTIYDTLSLKEGGGVAVDNGRLGWAISTPEDVAHQTLNGPSDGKRTTRLTWPKEILRIPKKPTLATIVAGL